MTISDSFQLLSLYTRCSLHHTILIGKSGGRDKGTTSREERPKVTVKGFRERQGSACTSYSVKMQRHRPTPKIHFAFSP